MLTRNLSTFGWPRRSLWREVNQLQREVNRLLGDNWSGGISFPAMNVWTNQDMVAITAELPGVEPDALEIAIDGDTLTLTGSRMAPDFDGDVRFLRRERTYGHFSRSLELPFRADPDKVEASFKHGVLQISVPRAEADKPRKIAVKAG